MTENNRVKKDVSSKIFKLQIPCKDNVEMAKKVLCIYNGVLNGMNESNKIDQRHIDLMAFYICFNYSEETKKRYSDCYGKSLKAIRTMDCLLKNKGFLQDPGDSYRNRELSDDMKKIRQYFADGSTSTKGMLFVFKRNDY